MDIGTHIMSIYAEMGPYFGDENLVKEDNILNLLDSHIDEFKFSYIASYSGKFCGNKTIIGQAVGHKHHRIVELLLKKYHEYDHTSLHRLYRADTGIHYVSHICYLMNYAIYVNDIDCVEILLKYVTDIGELNEIGWNYMDTANAQVPPNPDMIELLTMSGL